MITNIFLLLIFLACLAYLAMGLRRMEADMSGFRRDMDRLTRQQTELEGGMSTLEEMTAKEDGVLAGLVSDFTALKTRKDELEVELQAAVDAPKQRLFVFDKSTLIHGKLWEVRVVNDSFMQGGQPIPTAAEWAEGRICLVGSAVDRDARHRTESRFPSGQGYRIMSVERFRRG